MPHNLLWLLTHYFSKAPWLLVGFLFFSALDVFICFTICSIFCSSFLEIEQFCATFIWHNSSAIRLTLMLNLSNGVPTMAPNFVIIRPKSYSPELVLCSVLTGMLIAAS